MKIALGADPFAIPLKQSLLKHLEGRGIACLDADAGETLPFYRSAERVCRMIQHGETERGILICGSGAGMCVAANKFKGITAVSAESVFSAGKASAVNHANVLTLGAMIVSGSMANEMADAWLDTPFAAGLEDLRSFLEDAGRVIEGFRAE